MSTFKVPVVRLIKIGKHPSADTLSIWNGPQGPLVFKTGDFNEGDCAVFVPADSVVDLRRNEFQFLAGDKTEGLFRVRGIKLRGIPSVGLLLRVPSGMTEGDDAAEYFGITKYVPAQTHSFSTSADQAPAPNGVYVPTYDVENVWQFERTLIEGTSVEAMDYECEWSITEKIHGCNMKVFIGSDGKPHVGSRTRWVSESESNVWWQAFRKHEKLIRETLSWFPKSVLFGECFGKVQDLTYGVDGVDFRAFDVYDTQLNRFLPASATVLNGVPEILIDRFGSLRDVISRAQEWLKTGKSTFADQIIEGVVIRPRNLDLYTSGRSRMRLMTKVISPAYLSRKNGTEYQ